MSMITDKFVNDIPQELDAGLEYISGAYRQLVRDVNNLEDHHSFSVDFHFLLEAYCARNGFSILQVKLGTNKTNNVQFVETVFDDLQKKLETRKTISFVDQSQERLKLLFDNVFCYEFTEGDLGKIQELVNELREIISASELFTADHQQRILRRLEKLQGELHKKVSDLDRFWGLIGDAGVVIGKFGNDAKPIVDRIKEIADIVWRTQSHSEGLPSGTQIPLLKSGESGE
ncbi:MAG: hypothetical protein JKX84_03300 [Flavobacteriales bacterium]|nr:hypothetical protein [Flavobacteriales bacterium]